MLGITYALGLASWRSEPERMDEFLDTGIGAVLVGIVVLLQAIGLLWMDRMSRIRL